MIQVTMWKYAAFVITHWAIKKSRKKLLGDCVRDDVFQMKSGLKPGMVFISLDKHLPIARQLIEGGQGSSYLGGRINWSRLKH